MNEQLVVKNFGPIKDATVDFKRVTVFIGPTGGGKSTLAKLAAILREKNLILNPDSQKVQQEFDSLVKDYEMQGFGYSDCQVSWKSKVADYSLEGRVFSVLKNRVSDDVAFVNDNLLPSAKAFFELIFMNADRKNKEHDKGINQSEMRALLEGMGKISQYFPTPIYVPAERAFATIVDNSGFGLRRAKVAITATLESFLSYLENARKNLSAFLLPIFNIQYNHINGEGTLTIGPNHIIGLSQAASGIQTTLPLMLVVENLHDSGSQSFIIEEPELNLYPTAQQGLLNWLVEKCTKGENDLTITTHSPYILSSCNLLLEAYKVAQQRPELADEIDKIVPRAYWLNPEEFAAYYVADGTVKPITDTRTHLIGSNELDSVSGDISDSFRRLLQLKKQVA
jgi:predicted ATPase